MKRETLDAALREACARESGTIPAPPIPGRVLERAMAAALAGRRAGQGASRLKAALPGALAAASVLAAVLALAVTPPSYRAGEPLATALVAGLPENPAAAFALFLESAARP